MSSGSGGNTTATATAPSTTTESSNPDFANHHVWSTIYI